MLAEDVTTLRIREDADFEAAARPYLAQARKALMRRAEITSSGRLDDRLSLYASDAILVPTMADAPCNRTEAIARGFCAAVA